MEHYRITILGTGYVGLVTGVCLASFGHKVTCVDIDVKKIVGLKRGVMPFFEPGLASLVRHQVKQKRLQFSTDAHASIPGSEMIFMTVGTPAKRDGSVDLSYVRDAADMIGPHLRGQEIIISKSTVPVGTSQTIRRIIRRHFRGPFAVVSNPEFLREGVALKAFSRPDRVVLGYEPKTSATVKRKMRSLYRFARGRIIQTNTETAELIKYAANVFLAGEISFINSIARLCEEVGTNVEDVARALRADPRIGQKAFLNAGIGYGGLCFPKDIRALIKMSKRIGYRFSYLNVIEEVNRDQRKLFVDKIRRLVPRLRGAKVAILGLSFKPDTDDMRDAPSIEIIKRLLCLGAKITATDPVAIPTAHRIFGNSITYVPDAASALKGADVAGIVTEWPIYRRLNFTKVRRLMRHPNVVDGRNIFDPKKMALLGFRYDSIGRKNFSPSVTPLYT